MTTTFTTEDLSGVAVIFDLDGTLIDTADDLAAAMNHVLASYDLAPLSTAEVRHLVGHGAKALIAAGFRAAGRPLMPDTEMERARAAFIRFYRENIAIHSRPFDHALETLDMLARAGAALSVCTNKPQILADPLIDELGLTPLFSTVVGSTPQRPSKPDAAQALLCLERSGRDKAIFVGDSDTDILTAQAINAPCLLARFGYGPTLLSDKTAGAFDDYRDLTALIASLIAKR